MTLMDYSIHAFVIFISLCPFIEIEVLKIYSVIFAAMVSLIIFFSYFESTIYIVNDFNLKTLVAVFHCLEYKKNTCMFLV